VFVCKSSIKLDEGARSAGMTSVMESEMLSRIWKILRDLFVDGYLVVGLAAPLLSIGFTVLKASDAIPNLRDTSYAWALLPILIWVLAAYVRRDSRYITL
jgi:hypothetical protein